MKFKKLVEEGKVSECGRLLKAISGKLTVWYFDDWCDVEKTEFDIDSAPIEDYLKFGRLFYSKEHVELARDTMEAEQICRMHNYNGLLETMRRLGFEHYSNRHESYTMLIERFGEMRLKEILNQELEDYND